MVHWSLLCIVYSWMLARNRQAEKKDGCSVLLYYIVLRSGLHVCIQTSFYYGELTAATTTTMQNVLRRRERILCPHILETKGTRKLSDIQWFG